MANTVTSRTSAVAGSVVTHSIPGKASGFHLYLKYAKGGGVGNTASRLSMLMTSAAWGIEGLIRTIDWKHIKTTLKRQSYPNIEKTKNVALIADSIGTGSRIAGPEKGQFPEDHAEPDRFENHPGRKPF
jgi:hypothetical protein